MPQGKFHLTETQVRQLKQVARSACKAAEVGRIQAMRLDGIETLGKGWRGGSKRKRTREQRALVREGLQRYRSVDRYLNPYI